MAERDEDYCKRFVLSCKQEAESAKKNRMDLNKANFAMYQLDYDFSHKQEGQSKEVLSKTRNATEQIKSFFQQALADLGDWWKCEPRKGGDGSDMIVRPEEVQKMMNFMLGQADYFSHVGNSVQSGLLGSLSVSKVRGAMIPKPKFVARGNGKKGKAYKKNVVLIDDKTWELRFDVIRQEMYYPDPTGLKLYEIEECELDFHLVRAMAEGDDAIYDKEVVDLLRPWGKADLQEAKRARETGQNDAIPAMRPKIKITEFYGTIVDEDSGEIIHENVIMTLANEEHVIRKPTPNTHWHQRSPIVAAALIEVANSVWGVAMMDAGTKHNHSLIELFNLMLDSAMKAVWGISQIRVDALEDPTQVTDGIRFGQNIKVNAQLPIGGKVIEEVVTGKIPPEVMNMFNLVSQETMTSMMTNDLRMGAQSMRAVKATEVVAAENSITSVFQGMAKNFEEKKIQPELELAWMTIAQNWDLIDESVFESLYGKERGAVLAALEPQEVFVQTVNGLIFQVFGISLTLRRQADFRKWTTLLQVIGGSEVLIEAFLAKYSFEKFLGEVMTALDVDKGKIRNDDPAPPQAPAAPAMEQPGAAPGAAPDMASQQPSAASAPSSDPFTAAFAGMGMNMPSAQKLA